MKLISIAQKLMKGSKTPVTSWENYQQALSEAEEFEEIVEWAAEKLCQGLDHASEYKDCGQCPPCRARKLLR